MPDDYIPALRYETLTPLYDLVTRLTTREGAVKRALLAQADIQPGHNVLDIGCGTGTLTFAANQHQPDAHIFGLDGDPTILKIANSMPAGDCPPPQRRNPAPPPPSQASPIRTPKATEGLPASASGASERRHIVSPGCQPWEIPTPLTAPHTPASASDTPITFTEALSYNLPYANQSFDRVLCSLFFHHLQPDAKAATLTEIHRILRPDGQLHIADWGAATGPITRALFKPVQKLDGYSNTVDHVEGRLPRYLTEAGFEQVEVQRSFHTVFGILSLFSANGSVPSPSGAT